MVGAITSAGATIQVRGAAITKVAGAFVLLFLDILVEARYRDKALMTFIWKRKQMGKEFGKSNKHQV
jgi:hypothetical protein